MKIQEPFPKKNAPPLPGRPLGTAARGRRAPSGRRSSFPAPAPPSHLVLIAAPPRGPGGAKIKPARACLASAPPLSSRAGPATGRPADRAMKGRRLDAARSQRLGRVRRGAHDPCAPGPARPAAPRAVLGAHPRSIRERDRKKGLSAEEKRARMMEIFFETKDVFQLKDMEKIAPKEKGITAMSVKEVLQSLVDDGMVDCERIGTSNYYWAFPSKALHARKRKLEVLESQLSEGNQKHASLQKSIEKAKIGRHETEERAMLAKELSSLRDQREQLKAEVEKYKECDPQVVEEIRQANKVAKEAANRWTDNIFAIKSWAKRKFGFEENKIDKNFGIPEDFDYID
ncbi:meiotic nuclear division protein 1 homolog [Ursus maritimus]|uniref:Meiotic nuclear division protein 1 homolog n=2 Tax=Ursus maritimus TaxID=29073 RepID=A0A8M1FGL8_URSMA|nr:meiotic nuclear division protein 1 homolog [Ursus maritimus]